jgi:hypothetical protein
MDLIAYVLSGGKGQNKMFTQAGQSDPGKGTSK